MYIYVLVFSKQKWQGWSKPRKRLKPRLLITKPLLSILSRGSSKRSVYYIYKFEFLFFFLIYKHLLLMRKLVCCWNKNRPVEIQVQTWRGLSKRLMRRSSSWRTKLPGFPEMLWTCFSNMSPLSTTKIYTIRLKMVSSVIFEWIYSSFVSFMDSIFDFELQPWELLCSSLWRRTEYRSFVYCNKFQNKRKPMFFFFFLIMKGLLQWNSK